MQILNTHPQSGGLRFLSISTFKFQLQFLTVRCPKDAVNMFDSAGGFFCVDIC